MPSSWWNQSGLAAPRCGRGYLLEPTLWLLILRPILLQNLSGMGWDSASMSAAVSPPPAARPHNYQPTFPSTDTVFLPNTVAASKARVCIVLSLMHQATCILLPGNLFSEIRLLQPTGYSASDPWPRHLPDGGGVSGCHESSSLRVGSL